MSTANECKWPSIEGFVKNLEYNLNTGNDLFTERVIATEKIDGTNVGKDVNGVLWGRRIKIEGTSYQKCCLKFMDEIDVENVFKSFVENYKINNVEDFRLYGELGCNKGLYDYEQKGYSSKWHCFGATMNIKNEHVDDVIENIQKSFGIGIQKYEGKDESRITVYPSPEFFKFLEPFNIPTVPIKYDGNMENLVLDQKDWMMSNCSEGLVLTFPNTAFKWKQGHELTNDQMDLSVLKDKYEERKELFEHMFQIASNKPKKEKQVSKKEKKKVPLPLEEDIVIEALKSALTKYDSPDTWFEKGERKKFCEILYNECSEDLPLTKTSNPASKQVQATIQRHIGVTFSQWKKSKNAD